jgi:hypothetical protein
MWQGRESFMGVSNNYEGVELMLRLYDLRREPQLRKARNWYLDNFYPASSDEIKQKYPRGSEEEAHIRMVLSYWNMVASILNRGLMDETMFFENNGEMWVVWDRIRQLVPMWRSSQKDATLFRNLEDACKRYEVAREEKAPGSTIVLHRMIVEQGHLKRKWRAEG